VTEMTRIGEAVRAAAEALPATIARSMQDALKVVANAAATKYMIMTRGPRGKDNSLPASNTGVDATRLTWRTGNLARSLVRTDHPDNIQRIYQSVEGGGLDITGEVGTSVKYAAIHEYGGVIPPVSMNITEKMRSFFWVMWYKTKDEKWKFMALKRLMPVINIPTRTIRPRPFLGPASEDVEVRTAIQDLFAKRIPDQIASSMSLSLESRS